MKINKNILIHASIWCTFICINLLQFYFDKGDLPDRHIFFQATNIIIFYFNYFYLVPKFLLKKKTILYIFLALMLAIIPLFFHSFFKPEMPPAMHNMPDMPRPFMHDKFFDFGFIIPLFINIAFLVIGTSIRMYTEWNKNERHKIEYKTQKTSTELNFLKTQLNPHFLFNSLNSIYSLTKKKSNDASEAVITLSELMRYMLYQTENDFVLLKDELEYVQNYLKLQRLRIANNENVILNIRGDIHQQKIRPLLLISFIENAFKYGTDFKGNTKVKINIQIEGTQLTFYCENLIGNRKKSNENSGIGLVNTKERLAVLYPKKHELKISEKNHEFMVKLVLKLN